MAVLKFPPVLFFRASNPTAMFVAHTYLNIVSFFPIAVFLKPEVLDLRASSPTAVLLTHSYLHLKLHHQLQHYHRHW